MTDLNESMSDQDFLKLFETSDYNSLKNQLSSNQQNGIKKNIEFVKGSDFYKGYYDKNIVKNCYVKYYQFSIFNERNKRSVRSYLLKGNSSNGACFYDYHIEKVKDYTIKEDKLELFRKFIDKQNKTSDPNSETKIMYKYYPVYNFKDVPPPYGNEINQCTSELLN
jgi:hypothetical protein